MEEVENKIVTDWYWGEIEYGVPDHSHISEQARYERECEMMDRRWAEREDF